MTPSIGDFDLDTLHASEGCPAYDVLAPPTLSAPGNNPFRCSPCIEGTHYTFDPNTNVVDWIGNARNNVTIEWDWAEGGPCGVPPNNSSGVCLLVHTVEVQFGGSAPGQGANFNLRAVKLCDLDFGSCPEQQS